MNLFVRTGASLLGLLSFSLACDSAEGTDLGASGAEHRNNYYVYVGSKGWGCRDCGYTNSPTLGSYGFASLGYGATPGLSPNKLVEAVDPNGVSWPVSIDESELTVDKNGTLLQGFDLIDWTLIVKAADPKGGDAETYEVEVYSYEKVPGWDDNAEAVPTYGLSVYSPNSDTMVNVCPGFDLDMTSVVFLNRELYDLGGFGVADDVDNVASIACRGHALAKMKLLHYDPEPGAYVTTPDERLATLRMLTADYCGDGNSNTVLGTPVHWTDQLGHVFFDSSTMSSDVEAQWNENGALCANTTRLGGSTPTCDGKKLPNCDPTFGGFEGDAVWASMLVPAP